MTVKQFSMKRMTYFGNGFLLVGSTVDDKNDCRNGSRFWPFCKENQKNLVSRWKCYIQSRQMNTERELGVRMNVSHFSVQHFIACSSMPTSFLSIVVIDLIFLPKKSEKPINQNTKYRKKSSWKYMTVSFIFFWQRIMMNHQTVSCFLISSD